MRCLLPFPLEQESLCITTRVRVPSALQNPPTRYQHSNTVLVSGDTWSPVFNVESKFDLRRSSEVIIRGLAFTPDRERIVVAYLFHGLWCDALAISNNSVRSLIPSHRYISAWTGRKIKAIHEETATRL